MPALHPISPMRVWVQKILPLVYDDSLSYYELLNRVVAKINEMIGFISDDIVAEIEQVVNEYYVQVTYDAVKQCINLNMKKVN